MKIISSSKSLTLLAIFLSLLLSPGCRSTDTADPAHPEPGPLVWCGLDYSVVKMIGTKDFHHPDQIFPQMLIEWNAMFMKETFPYVQRNAKLVTNDLSAVEARNAAATTNQVQNVDGTYEEEVAATDITPEQIASIVASYKLKVDKGTGLVFIMDRLVKKEDFLCAYVVLFDLETRKVLYSKRRIKEATKGTFRSHWYKPIRSIAGEIPTGIKAAREAR